MMIMMKERTGVEKRRTERWIEQQDVRKKTLKRQPNRTNQPKRNKAQTSLAGDDVFDEIKELIVNELGMLGTELDRVVAHVRLAESPHERHKLGIVLDGLDPGELGWEAGREGGSE